LSAIPASIAASLDPVVDAAALDLGGLRVFVLVDDVLVRRLRHQARGLRLHPRGHEGGQVEPGVAVQHQLVVDDLVCDLGVHRLPGDAQLGHTRAGRPGRVEGVDLQIRVARLLVVQCHVVPSRLA
jgi:hypothetical protein